MTRFSSQALDELLGTGIRQLDITPAERSLAVARYGAVARSLDNTGTRTPTTGGSIPRGRCGWEPSPATSTETTRSTSTWWHGVTSPRNRSARPNSRRTPDWDWRSSSSVKPQGGPALDEGKRCWTLHYPGFHLDVLPALPNLSAPSDSAIIITDTEVVCWQFSNPIAYADWFHEVMAKELEDKLKVIAKRMDIAQVSDWQVKTTLQQTVQALKRHRDIYFTDQLDQRPASIIITTLAAHAYRGGGDLYEVDDITTQRRPSPSATAPLHRREPVEPRQHFPDCWNAKPERARPSSGGSSRPGPTSTACPVLAADSIP